MSDKLFTIYICTYNGGKLLRSSIPAVLSAEGFCELVDRFVVVDNASTDDTQQVVCEFSEKCSLIEYAYEKRRGVAYARQAVLDARTKWVIFVDDDNVIDSGYLRTMANVIASNKNVGVINGAVIAAPESRITANEEFLLRKIFPSLACSHVDYPSYLAGDKSALLGPVGAGMVFLHEPLVEFAKSGWTTNVGRRGEHLGSGEDGEIARAILSKGYDYCFCGKTFLWHIIPKRRLQYEYASKLQIGLAEGNFIYCKSLSRLFHIKLFVKLVIQSIALALKTLVISKNDNSQCWLRICRRACNYRIELYIRGLLWRKKS